MFATLRKPRNPLLRIGALLSAAWLAACQPMASGGSNGGQTIDTGAPVPVALLVPSGSGNSGDETLAASLKQAAELAISDLEGVKIDLRVYSTAGNAGKAAEMASKAVDDGAKIILGPVFAEEANAAAVAVASRDINVLSFSNNTDIAGGNVFVLGPPGVGKHTLVLDLVRARADTERLPDDWVYVQNFAQQHRPRALRLPHGVGVGFRDEVRRFKEDARASIAALFESDEYRNRAEQIDTEITEQQHQAFESLGADAAAQQIL